MSASRSGQFVFALVVAVTSGAAALSHELLWARRLIDLLGGSYESAARVVGVFFLGLSLGSAVTVRLVPRTRAPWLALALIELAVALTVVPAWTLPAWSDGLWPILGRDRLVHWTGGWTKLGLSVLVVLPPALCMGMTLPFLARAALGEDRTLGRQGVWLYAANTLGGVVGLLATSVVTLRWLGVAGAISWTMAVNLLVAVSCLVWHRKTSAEFAHSPARTFGSQADARTAASKARKVAAKGKRSLDTVRPDAVLEATGTLAVDSTATSAYGLTALIAFVSGAGVLSLEILVLHLVSNVVPSCVHTTTAILTVVLTVLGVAALLVPWLRAARAATDRLLTIALWATALTTAAAPFLFVTFTSGLRPLPPTTGVIPFLLSVGKLLLLTFGPGILGAAFVFPLTFSWHAQRAHDPRGLRWGWLLAANGLGGLAGAELANRVLMPLWGIHGAIAVVAIAYGATGGILFLQSLSRRTVVRPRASSIAAVSATILLGMMAYGTGHLPLMYTGSRYGKPLNTVRPGEETADSMGSAPFGIVDIRCGWEGIVAVVQERGPKSRQSWVRAIVHDNQFRLGSVGASASERRKLLLPLVLHPDPRTVGCIGLATGITAGAAMDDPRVVRVEAVEISASIARMAEAYFTDANRGIFTDPRARIFVEDGRTYVAASAATFDVLVADLFRPWEPGVGRLYSYEHFSACKRSLKPGGLFCQWLPMYQLTAEQFEVILATFQQVFPDVLLFRGSLSGASPTLGLVAVRDGSVDWSGLARRCELFRSHNVTTDPTLRYPEGVLIHYMGGCVRQDPVPPLVNRLDNAWVEMDAGRVIVSLGAGRPYLERQRWWDYEPALFRQFRVDRRIGGDVERWVQRGRQLTLAHWAVQSGWPEAAQLAEDAFSQLPEPMVRDPQCDWSAWPLRRRTAPSPGASEHRGMNSSGK